MLNRISAGEKSVADITFEQMEASFDIWADRLMAHIRQADLDSLSKAHEHIRLILLADIDDMRKSGHNAGRRPESPP